MVCAWRADTWSHGSGYTPDRLADLIGRNVAAVARAAPASPVVVDLFAGSGNTLSWIKWHTGARRAIGFELDDVVLSTKVEGRQERREVVADGEDVSREGSSLTAVPASSTAGDACYLACAGSPRGVRCDDLPVGVHAHFDVGADDYDLIITVR